MTKIENTTAKSAKAAIKEALNNYDFILAALWEQLKKDENSGAKQVNSIIAGLAGSEGMKPFEWLISEYGSRYYDNAGNLYKKQKGGYKAIKFTAQSARCILRNALSNCIESQRLGSSWKRINIDE